MTMPCSSKEVAINHVPDVTCHHVEIAFQHLHPIEKIEGEAVVAEIVEDDERFGIFHDQSVAVCHLGQQLRDAPGV